MKPKVRIMSSGEVFRMWPGGLGAVSPLARMKTIEQAVRLKDFYAAAYASGYRTAGDRK